MNRKSVTAATLVAIALFSVVALDLRKDEPTALATPTSGVAAEKSTRYGIETRRHPNGPTLDHSSGLPSEDAEGATGSNLLRLQVEDEHAMRIVGARLVVVRDAKIVADDVTDGEGRLELPGGEGRATVLLLAIGRAWERHEISFSGDQTLIMRVGAILAGRAIVGGGRQPRPLRMRVWQGNATKTLPEGVCSALWSMHWQAGYDTIEVDPDGYFRVAGLAPDRPVRLVLGEGFSFRDPDHEGPNDLLILPRPRDDLVLDLVAVPRVAGRVLDGLTMTPRSAFNVGAAITYTADAGQETRGTITDEEGRFAISLRERPIESVRVHLHWGGRILERRHDGEVKDTLDVGDVVLEPLRTWSFRVVDLDGLPVEGAVVQLGEQHLEARAGVDGIGRFAGISGGLEEALVGAAGFRPRLVAILTDSEVQEITLAPAALLEVVLENVPPEIVSTAIELIGTADLAPELFDFDLETATRPGLSFVSRDEGRLRVGYQASGRNRFVVHGLRAGIEFTVLIRTADDQVIAERDGLRSGDAGKQVITISFDASRRRPTAITCHDPLGNPLEGVEIADADRSLNGPWSESDDSKWGPVIQTDDDGRVLLVRDARRESRGIQLQKEGYATVLVDAAELIAPALLVVLMPDSDR